MNATATETGDRTMNATATELNVSGFDGNSYTVWHVDGKIVATACQGRWAKSSVATGSDWLDAKLQNAVDASLEI